MPDTKKIVHTLNVCTILKLPHVQLDIWGQTIREPQANESGLRVAIARCDNFRLYRRIVFVTNWRLLAVPFHPGSAKSGR
eukprot:9136681-Pyramimonas_sp.AAC.1